MRLLSFKAQGQASFGAVTKDGVHDLGVRQQQCKTLREFLGAGDSAANNPPHIVDYRLSDIEFLPTITDPDKVICIGVNYPERNDEYKDGTRNMPYPSVFMRTIGSLVGHLENILHPPESDMLDYEGEIAIVIGKAGRRIPRDKAMEHVGGLTLMNDGTLRDFVRHSKFNVTQGKNFEKSGSIGPWLVTPDEVDPSSDLSIQTRVNGDLRQNDSTNRLLFSFSYLISYLSTFFHLQPGDIIATGTPTGAGARRDPPCFLSAGDFVEVEVQGIGTLANRVAAEFASQ